MVRPYGVKGHKKRKKTEKYDREEDFTEEEVSRGPENASNSQAEEAGKAGKGGEVEEAPRLSGIPVMLSDSNTRKPGVIFILENASLEVAKIGKSYELLNGDKQRHRNILQRSNKNPADYRPDIAHQALLMILDSTIAKAGRLRAVYVKTQKGDLIDVKPHVRIPRTFDRFCGLMLQLLQKLSITAVGKREKLIRMIKNPVTQYLPANSRKIGFSHSSDKLVNILKYVNTVNDDTDLVFVVGAMAHGKIEPDYVDDYISISGYPLSAAFCIANICVGLANKWDIL